MTRWCDGSLLVDRWFEFQWGWKTFLLTLKKWRATAALSIGEERWFFYNDALQSVGRVRVAFIRKFIKNKVWRAIGYRMSGKEINWNDRNCFEAVCRCCCQRSDKKTKFVHNLGLDLIRRFYSRLQKKKRRTVCFAPNASVFRFSSVFQLWVAASDAQTNKNTHVPIALRCDGRLHKQMSNECVCVCVCVAYLWGKEGKREKR